MSPGEYFGLLANIPVIQSLRVLEGAAALALLFAPDKVKAYLKEVGVEPTEVEEEVETIFNIHDLTSLQSAIKRST